MTKKKNTSPMKKLIPAVGMLAISATMLGTSTYAWFTMSKTAEITGINMSATAPAGIEVSLGAGTNSAAGLTLETGETPTHTYGIATAPSAEADWAHAISFSEHYKVSKLKPASSVNGVNLFYTEGADQAGKNVASGVEFSAVTTADYAGGAGIAKNANDAAYYTANQEGYYVDFPVWLRTSATDENVEVGVSATFAAGTNSPDLYKAARVAVLNSGRTANLDSTNSGIMKDTDASYYTRASKTENTDAVSGAGVVGADTSPATFAAVNELDDETTIVTLTKAAKNETTNALDFTPTQIWVRVWLEGEDESCWDANASQDFSISLTFTDLTHTS